MRLWPSGDLRLPAALMLLTLWILPGVLATSPHAAEIEPEQSLRVCRNWLELYSSALRIASHDGSDDFRSGRREERLSLSPILEQVWELRHEGRLVARCYPLRPSGHLIVAADASLPPVPAFSEDSDLDPHLSPTLVQALAERLAIVSDEAPVRLSDIQGRIRDSWKMLSDPAFDPAMSLSDWSTGMRQEGPLLMTEWHQGEPFRRQCPMGDGGRTAVGCGPLAMAQIMRYHSWPPYGVGAVEYFWEGDRSCGGMTEGAVLHADLTNPYNWEQMPDDCRGGCTSEEIAALAEVCYEVGVAGGATYGVCGTSISRFRSQMALIDHFRFATSSVWERRSSHTAESWLALIQDEIDLRRPMLYFITGHLLVCDGWMGLDGSRMIHVNWGDGGSPYSGWWDVDGLPTGQDPVFDQLLPGIRPLCSLKADGSGLFPTIQDALDSVPAGTVIELEDGIYRGRGNHDLEIRERNIEIRSASGRADQCIIDCGGSVVDPRRAFHLASAESGQPVIEGLTIRNGFQARGGAILCENGSSPVLKALILESNWAQAGGAVASINASPSLDEVRLQGNHAELGGALYIETGDVDVAGCVFIDNRALEKGGGVYLREGVVSLVSSTLFRNQAPNGSGVHAGPHVELDLSHCIVSGGVGGTAVGVDGAASLSLACCNLYDNEGGDWTGPIEHLLGIDGNMEADPLFCNPGEYDLGLHFLSPCAKDNNPECGGIGAYGTACGAGAVVVLHPDGGGIYPTIQAAVNAAFDGVVIELAPGVYDGPGNRDVNVVGKQIEFRGQTGDPADCVLDCVGDEGQRHRAFDVSNVAGSPVVFSGLTIRNGAVGSVLDLGGHGGGAVRIQDSDSDFIDCVFEGNSGFVAPWDTTGHGGAILGRNSSISFTRCKFSENRAVHGGALSMTGGQLLLEDCELVHNSSTRQAGAVYVGRGDAEMTGCILIGNQAAAKGGGIHVHQGSVSLVSSTLFRNEAPEGSGIYTEPRTSLDLLRCIVAEGRGGPGIGGDATAQIEMACCNLFGNEGGDWIGPIAHLRDVDGNMEDDPLFCDPDEYDLGLHFMSPCAEESAAGCGQVGALGISCGAGTVVVLNADGSGVYPTIQAAVDAAVDGVVIELSPGVYRGPGNRDVRVSGKQLEFRGQTGNPADCLLDCQGEGDERHRAFVLTGDGESASSVFSGLTIRNGSAVGVTDPGEQGGGAVSIKGMAVEFFDCVFEYNSGFVSPGRTNGHGGAVLAQDARLSFVRCGFSGNQALHGGAVLASESSIHAEGCTFVWNQADRGGAVYADDSSVFEAEGCTFAWNQADVGGALWGPLEPVLASCTFFGNDAVDGSAFFGAESCLRMSQTLIASGLGGEAIVCSESSCHELECMDIFGNAGGDWTGVLSQYLNFDGNISLDPLFCEPDSSDFRLSTSSPCATSTPPNPQCELIGAWPAGCESNGGEDPEGARIRLSRPQPNPSAGTVQFICEILVAEAPVPVTLWIHDISGRRLWEYRAEFSPGKHFMEWDGRDSSGRRVASGVYMARIEAGGYKVTERLVVLR